MLLVTKGSLIVNGFNLWFLEDLLKKGISFDGLVVFTTWDSAVKWIEYFNTLHKFAIKAFNTLYFCVSVTKLVIVGVHVVFKLDLDFFFLFDIIHFTLDTLHKNISESLTQQVDICLVITRHCLGDDWLDRLDELGLVTIDHVSNVLYMLASSVSTRLFDLIE